MGDAAGVMRSLGRCRGLATASCGQSSRKWEQIEGGRSGLGHTGGGKYRTCDRHWGVHCNTGGLGAGHKHWDNGSGRLVLQRQRGTGSATSRAKREPEL